MEVMFEMYKFTEKAEKALNGAVSLAEELGHTYIGSEHLLLGLLSDSRMVSSTALSNKKITLKKLIIVKLPFYLFFTKFGL